MSHFKFYSAYLTTYSKHARVAILEQCEGMEDLSGAQVPFDEANPDKNWISSGSAGIGSIFGWFKWQHAVPENVSLSANYYESDSITNGSRKWTIIGDDSSFFLVNSATVNGGMIIPYGFCCIQHNEKPKPYLFATNRYHTAKTSVLCETPLGKAELISVASLYNRNGQLDTTRFSRLVPGMRSNLAGVISGGPSNDIKTDPVLGYMLTPFYVLDADLYLIGQLPLVKFCVSEASTLADKTMLNLEDDYFMSCRFRHTANGLYGSLFFKVHEGGLL